MLDRLAMYEHRPQRYGSQMICEAGRHVPCQTEDSSKLDARRASLSMKPYLDYLALFAHDPLC